MPSRDQTIIRFSFLSFFCSHIFQLDKAHLLKSERQISGQNCSMSAKKNYLPSFISTSVNYEEGCGDKWEKCPALNWPEGTWAGVQQVPAPSSLRQLSERLRPSALLWRRSPAGDFVRNSIQQYAGLAIFQSCQSFAYWNIFTILRSSRVEYIFKIMTSP